MEKRAKRHNKQWFRDRVGQYIINDNPAIPNALIKIESPGHATAIYLTQKEKNWRFYQ